MSDSKRPRISHVPGTKAAARSRAKNPPEPVNVSVSVRMKASERNKFQKAANADGRTLNNWLLQLARKAVA